MVKRNVVSLSLYEEDKNRLEKLCEESGMTASELIRTAVEKIYCDKVELTILMQNFLKKEAKKISKERLLRIMSIRSTIKKDMAKTQRSATSVSVSEDQKQNTPYHELGLGLHENLMEREHQRLLDMLPDEEDLENE